MLIDWAIRTAKRHRNFLIFGTIGAMNTGVHAGFVIAFVELLEAHPTVANFFAFVLANISSYILNSLLTFRAPLSLMRYVKFFASSLVTLVITLAISQVGQYFNVHYLYSLATIIVLTPLISFFIMNKFVFNKTTSNRQ